MPARRARPSPSAGSGPSGLASASRGAPASEHRPGRRRLAAVASGVLVALSLPPWGWWPLGLLGLAGMAWLLAGLSARARAGVGLLAGLGVYVPGLWWMVEFHPIGAVLVMLLETAFFVAAVVLCPPRWRIAGLPAAFIVAEAARATWPFGGLPMAGIAIGQVGGPLGAVARVGGELLVVGVAVLTGAALAALARRRRRAAFVGFAVAAVAITASTTIAPDGDGGESIRAALVQGGGRRGFRAVHSDVRRVLDAHLAASRLVQPPVDLVLWPEDVVDVSGSIAAAPEREEVAAVARTLDTTLVAGVVEDSPDGASFHNAAVAFDASGRIIDRYDKVRRVPFGEYIPGRALVDRVADLSVVPRDAVPGTGPGLLRTPAGRLGVLISFEVFFSDRGRAATNAGGQVLLVPTNAASFTTTQVPTTQIGAARLRAIESGRDLVQAGPTGYGAFVDHRGRVRARTVLGGRQVIHRTVTLRSGRTVYARLGDGPWVAASGTMVAAGWLFHRRRERELA